MGLIWRRRVRVDEGTDVNASKGGGSLSHRIGRRLRVNSRGGGAFRLFKRASWRFGRRR